MSKIGSASQLFLLACFTFSSFGVATAAASSNAKRDTVRANSKAAKPETAKLKETGKTKDKQLAKAEKANKAAEKTRKESKDNKDIALSGKNAKSKNAKDKASKTKADEKVLSSRLVRANFVAATASEERRGKFGKGGDTAAEDEDKPRNKETANNRLRASKRSRPVEADEDDTAEPLQKAEKQARRPRETNAANDGPAYEISLPDRIEVAEFGSNSPMLTNLLALPTQRPSTPFGAVVTRENATPTKRNDLNMSQQRVLEIQYQLAKRGFFNVEPNGVYDEVTVRAMWEFQKNYGLPATGYPSAHALKRLGLTTW